ncbi:MAG TPA: RagB/SusD family nutrient uptake outer membrane protein [Gemmatimonadaceae bacterium]|nr:RagB/SusD family nutrient uptake outer membrane protein [Gemmatimonadaceae bacterium]
MTPYMRLRWTVPVLLVALAAACDDTLTVEPINEVAADVAIVDAATARAAVAGAYDALQDDASATYYSGDFAVFSDLSGDDVRHSGTFDTYRQADRNQLAPSNGTIEDIWEQLYVAVTRVNRIIEKLPSVPGLEDDERDDLLGQAYFLRALSYHNLVKLFGGVPLRLTTPASTDEAANIARASVDETYAQIFDDLDQAIALIQETGDVSVATRGAAWALLSRVHLFRGNWADVVTAADSAESYGYDLTPDFGDLFQAEGGTEEDIFKIPFTAEEAHFLGWYYRAKGYGGRYELAPTCALVNAFDSSVNCAASDFMTGWSPSDDRAAFSIDVNTSSNTPFASKYATGIGDEDLHVIRFAEVILNRAEAFARLNNLAAAVADYNRTRVRAGLAPHVLGVDVTTQEDVLNAIWQERRLELAFEGFRWPDLVRTGRAVTVLGIGDRPHQVLYPIPQAERDVTNPPLDQNPGY